jgi:putative FmdB family regulatory protein
MPLYTYLCSDHGEFSAWGRLATSDAPEACPTCAEPSPRALARPNVSTGGEAQAAGECGMGGCGMGACEAPAPSAHMCGAGCVH